LAHDTSDLPPQGASFTLSGPAKRPDPLTTPVRGDLAHIRLVGQVFVAHYIVPQPHRALADAPILKAPHGEAHATLAAGEEFHVLDSAGTHAWGEVPGGAVGYIALDLLEKLA
jgi:hypothetical protein